MVDSSDSAARVVIALGGNAILAEGQRGEFDEQFANTRAAVRPIADLIDAGRRVVITHGNGPQVGAIMARNAFAGDHVPQVPLAIAGAMTAGSIGFMIAQSLRNELTRRAIARDVVTIPGQMVVAADDPAFAEPTKPIGAFYSAEEASRLAAHTGWVMREDAGRGFRRVVPSPKPQRLVEEAAVRSLVEGGFIVITAGGGGIPVVADGAGRLAPVDAVIDKDLASVIVGDAVGADSLVFVTGVPQVMVDFGTPRARAITTMTVAEAQGWLDEGQFPAGSMGPKVRAAISFVAGGATGSHGSARSAIITDIPSIAAAVRGEAGTRIVAT